MPEQAKSDCRKRGSKDCKAERSGGEEGSEGCEALCFRGRAPLTAEGKGQLKAARDAKRFASAVGLIHCAAGISSRQERLQSALLPLQGSRAVAQEKPDFAGCRLSAEAVTDRSPCHGGESRCVLVLRSVAVVLEEAIRTGPGALDSATDASRRPGIFEACVSCD